MSKEPEEEPQPFQRRRSMQKCKGKDLIHEVDMAVLPTPEQLAELEDEHLERLAAHWRTRASHGERDAFGIAHALEVELRRRTRDSRLQDLPPPVPSPQRPWWKFWGSGGRPPAAS